jgi:hypothetical protein
LFYFAPTILFFLQWYLCNSRCSPAANTIG